MATPGRDGASCDLAARLVESRPATGNGDRGERGEELHVVHRLANSQSTAKTMADDGTGSTYCTLPRPARVPPKADEFETESSATRTDHQGQFYTLRPLPPAGSQRAIQLPPAALVAAMGNVAGTRLAPASEDGWSEANRSLLYEQNMCTFENYCERRTSEQQLHGTASERDTNHDGGSNSAGEGLANFCTLRKGHRGWSGVSNGDGLLHSDGLGNANERVEQQSLGGDYCTLKKKTLQLNRKFVESFLEDPNAQVVDYLSELDAYLDEMYDEDDDDEAAGSGGGESDEQPAGVSEVEEKQSDVSSALARSDRVTPWSEGVCSQSLQYYHATPNERCGAGSERDRDTDRMHWPVDEYQEDRIQFGDIKHFCTLPKQKRIQVLNAFKRGASLRRTIVGPSGDSERLSDQTIPETDGSEESSGFNGDGKTSALPTYGQSRNDASHHHHQQHPRWHRHSMRKQHLIELPEPQEFVDGTNQTRSLVAPSAVSGESLLDAHTLDIDSSLGDVSDEQNEFSSISTLPVGEVPAATPSSVRDGEGDPIDRICSLVVALPPSPGPLGVDRIDRELVVPSAPPSASPPPPLETDLDEGGLVQERPRQTGRRSQSQPRIGSITVERDEETNELIIRTHSVAAAPTAPYLDGETHVLADPLQQQQRSTERPSSQAHHHTRYGATESEGSSIGSSRNPSPVSLLSTTTTYSSIASVNENADDRALHVTELPGEGTAGTGVSTSAEEVATIASSTSNNSRRYRNSATVDQHRRSTSTTGNEASVATVVVGPSDSDDHAEEESEAEIGTRRSSRRSDGRPKARWPHAISRTLATTFCTLGLFNISRFAVFSVHFGANFVVQFLIFSIFFGIPMMWLQMVLGARIRGGPVTMWRVSPICKGIGIALLLAQAIITLYSAISLAWVLVYFRDAFITHNEKYRWQEPFEAYRGAGWDNQSYRLPDTVADYFNGVVLQRYHLIHQGAPSGTFGGNSRVLPRTSSGIGAIRFQLAFNMAILWTLVFVALCRGIRSLGKVVIGLFLIALPALVAVCAKLLTFISYDSVQSIFPATDWQDFFLNSRSWTCAAQETFLTWGLLGVSIYALNCRSNRKGSCNVRTKRELRRDAFLVAFITLMVLILAGVLGSACVQVLNSQGYYYSPGSYENLGTNVFLRHENQPLPPQHGTMMPNRWLIRYSTVVGESFKRSYADPSRESGYQVLRLVTELLPAALAAATPEHIQPIWGLLAYLSMLLFGLGQLCVMWKPIAGAIGDAPSSILLSCVTGLLLGMPLATEGGINIVHYLDTILGAAWWVLLLWIGHILALFLVRGRPFTSDILVNDLQVLQSFSAFVAFAWNFLVPIGLIFMCIIQYRLSNSAALFNWPSSPAAGSSSYWPLWARQVGGFAQVSFLLLVPIVMVVQIYRYLCSGPPDILDRVDLLLRPPAGGNTSNPNRAMQSRRPPMSAALQPSSSESTRNTSASQRDGSSDQTISLSLDARTPRDAEDAPPKYTPPPSYTTATGARIAKMLRNSIRRSVRRIMGESSGAGGAIGLSRQRVALPRTSGIDPCDSLGANPSSGGELPPPDYCSVLQQFGEPLAGGTTALDLGRQPRALYNSSTLGSGRRYRSLMATGNSSPEQQLQSQPLTASDVRQILRPATIGGIGAEEHTTVHPATASGFTQTLRNTLLRRGHSMENLVLAAAPIGDSSIITLNCDDNDYEDASQDRNGIGRDSVI